MSSILHIGFKNQAEGNISDKNICFTRVVGHFPTKLQINKFKVDATPIWRSGYADQQIIYYLRLSFLDANH